RHPEHHNVIRFQKLSVAAAQSEPHSMVSKRLSTLRARDALLHEVLLAMRRGTAALSALVIAFSVVLTAQGQEFARVLRNGEQATLSVFGPRPVDLAAKKLVDEFRVVSTSKTRCISIAMTFSSHV